jgi:exosome complex component CSL4
MKTNAEKIEITTPGQELSTTEEYVSGKNTLEEDGKILAAINGLVQKDEKNLVMSVRKIKPRVFPQPGDVVYGQVVKLDQRFAIVSIAAICRTDDDLMYYHGDSNLRLGESGNRRDVGRNLLRIGDLVRARVVKIFRGTPDISITGKHYGVLKTLCDRCRNPMVLKNGTLYCDNCEKTDLRKIADDYGEVLTFGDGYERN